MNHHRLLIVEDEVIVALDIKDRLAAMGYELVGHATNGELALRLVRECRPDLVLMDIRLQGAMDGITAAEIMRGLHIPVIFLTAYSEDETLERAKVAEPYGYILKPFDDRELKSAVEIALHKHRAAEEIRHLNRLYDVLSQVSQTVVRVHTREELLSELCRVLVARGNVDLAWIGWLDPDTSQLTPVAWAGKSQDLLTQAAFAADSRPEGQGNPGKALRSGEPSICNRCAADQCLFPAGHTPERFGFQSCGSFPLLFQNQVCAVLNICVAEPGFFSDREIELLQEVALDVSFALDKIEADAQRLRLNDELQRQSAFLTTLLEALPSPVFYKDAQFRYLGCNPAYEQLLGVSRDELIGKTAQELWPSDLADSYHRADQDLLASNITQIYEGHVPAADGSRKDVVFHKAAYRNPDGGLGGIIGIVEDVTERKAAGLALRDSEERFRAMFESASVGMAQADPHTGRFLRVNQKMSAITGYTTDELLGMSFREITHPADVGHDWHLFQQVMGGEAPSYHHEKRYIRKDGAVVWVNINSTLHRDSAGQPLHSLAVIEDITARKEAEADLRESQARLHLALAAANMGFWEWDLTTDDLFWSPECFNILGEVTFTGKLDAFVKIVHPEDLDRVMATLRQAVDRREAYAEEFRVFHENGDIIWVANLGRAEYDQHGKPLRMVGIVQDITPRRQAEAEVRRLASFPELNPNPVLEFDARGVPVYANPAALQVVADLDLSEGERSFLPPDFAELFARVGQGGPRQKSFDLILKDKAYAVSLTFPQDLPTARVYALDITLRQQTEAALQQSERRFRQMAKAVEEVFWISSPDFQSILYISPAFEKVWGQTCAELYAKPRLWLEALHPDDHFLARRALMELSRGQPYNIEYRIIRPDGSSRWINDRGYPLLDEAGQVILTSGVASDITEHKEAEDALRRAKEEWELTFNAVPDLIAIIDENHRITRGNRAMAEALGLAPAEVIGRCCYEAMHRTAAPPDFCPHSLTLHDGRDHTIEVFELGRHFLVTTSPLQDDKGQSLGSVHVARDITELKQVENALRDSEEKFRLAMEAIQEGVWDWHIPAGKLFISHNYMRLFGYDPEEVENTYEFWQKAIHPEDFPPYQDLLLDHLAGNCPNFEVELRGRIGDGSYRWFRSRGKVVARAGDGAPLRMVGALRDITEEKEARQALEESLSLYQATLEATADGIMVLDLNSHIVSWNQRFTEMWRIPESLINSRDGKRVRTFAMDQVQDPRGYLAKSEKLFANPEEKTCDLIYFKDGRIFERNVFPQYLNNRIVGRVLSFRDVTARLQAEAALRKSEAGYRRIVETANEGIWAVDAHQSTTYVNQLMAEMLGYSREEMLGRPVTDFIFPDDLADHQDIVNRRQRGKYEQRLKRQDGSELWTIVSVRALLGEAGEFLGSFAMLTDITERKRAEEKLKESERRVRTKLESILTPEGDIGQLDLGDIVDVQAIQSLMDDFYQLTQIPMFLVDMKGQVLVAAGWQDICSKFHRVHPKTRQRCIESDTILSRNVPPGTFKLYECKNHMLDLVTPITVGGKHVGNLFLGQFFYADKEPDYDVFRAQAREFGFDEEAYLTVLTNAPRLTRQTADRAMGFFTKLAHMISLLSLSNIKLARAVAAQDRLVESLRLSEEKSRAGEEFLSDIFNSIRDGITILDLDRTIIGVNPAAQSFSCESNILGRKCHEVFHQQDSVCPSCPVGYTLTTGKANQAVVKVGGGDGNDRFVEIFCHPLTNRSTGQVQGVIEYVRDVTERRRAEAALAKSHRELQETARELEQSRNMLQLILESIPVRVFWKDKESLLLGCNTLYACDAGFQHPEEILGKDDFAMGWREKANLYREDDRQVMESRRPRINIIEPQTTPTGAQIWLKTSKVPLSGSNGQVFGVLGVYEDITELKETESQLRASLAEKEVMLKEIHHRVKNNMQMISTLFDLQLKYGRDQDPSMVFRDCQNRIRSMALVHESLYHTDTLASINFRQYLEKLINRLLASFGSKVQGIRARVSGPEIFLGINQAVPAGLVASELIVNCLKHAFPEQQPGEIRINLVEDDGRRVIEIKDNGIGLDPELSLEQPATFGWLMITNLMKQLDGKITVTSSGGTICRMVF